MVLEVVAAVFAGAVVVLALLYRHFTSTFDYFEKQGVSGPKPVLVFGNWWGAWNKFLGEEDVKNVKEYGKVYGTFDGRTPNLIVADPDLAKIVLVKECDNFTNRRAALVKNEILRDSLLILSDSEPKEVKNALSHTVSGTQMRKLVPSILKCAGSLAESVVKKSDPDGKVDVSRELSLFVNNVVALSLLGLDLQDSASTEQQFTKHISQAFCNDSPDSALSLLPFLYPSLSTLDNFILSKEATKYFTQLIQNTIDERRKPKEPTPEKKPTDLVDLLLEAAEEEKKVAAKEKGAEEQPTPVLNDRVLVTEILAVILESSLAATNALALSVHALATNPNAQEKLHAELSKQLHAHGGLSYETVHNSEYLDMFIAEVLRLYPSEFRIEKQCIQETQLDTPVKVTPGVVVSIPVWALHRSEEIYPEPEDFNPDRFLPETAEKRSPYAYLPFGQAGFSATNLSVQYGLLISKIALASLVKAAKYSPSDETKTSPQFEKGVTGVARPENVTVSVASR